MSKLFLAVLCVVGISAISAGSFDFIVKSAEASNDSRDRGGRDRGGRERGGQDNQGGQDNRGGRDRGGSVRGGQDDQSGGDQGGRDRGHDRSRDGRTRR